VALWIRALQSLPVQETLRCTPAMAIDVADHIWTIAELAQIQPVEFCEGTAAW
jgi:hypothetical protein